MDFEDTPEEADFRAGARTFLEKNAKRREPGAGMVYRAGNDSPEFRQKAKDWQARKADAGYAGITWSKDWGGRGGTAIQQVIYDQEEAKFAVPRGLFDIGLGMCIPTLCTWGTQAQRDRFARKALRGEEIWCQLFSEPAAGSDLAGLRTRAERDGDDWIVNGQKIWTSGAQYCDFGVLVTRSDFSAQKHKGLTYFFIDMKTPGIEIKPIKQISGASHFNEVFFTDVRIPDGQRLGAPGDGWKVSLTTLMNERYTIGGRSGVGVEDIFELARKVELDDGPALKNEAVRDKLADWYVMSQGLKYSHFRTMTALSRGDTPGPESSIGKLVNGSKLQNIATFAMDLMEQGGILTDPELAPLAAVFQQTLMTSPSSRIAGGSDEIMRNIIAERVLGLPADVRVDKELPFNKLPTGKAGGARMTAMDIAALRRHIGTRIVDEDVATQAPLKAIVATFDRQEEAPREGQPIPEGWHIGYFLSTAPTATLAADGLPSATGVLPKVPLPRRMYAGTRITFHAALRIGDPLRRETELTDLQMREGGTGTLLVTTQTRRISTPRGLAITEEYDTVFREEVKPGAKSGIPKRDEVPANLPWRRAVTAGPVALFRFSALTGNPHRIHYDRPYAMEAEGYPGLVVHGPFTQACLTNFVRDQNPGRSIRTFVMRARAPLFDTAPFDLTGRPTQGGAGCEVWAVTPAGTIAMQASATLD